MNDPNLLLKQILSPPEGTDRSRLAYRLLEAFHRGYSVTNLRPLLLHEDLEILKRGIWLASEVGARIRPLIADVVPLLRHSAKYVRYYALDGVLLCADAVAPNDLVDAIALIDDPAYAVRWRVMTTILPRLPTSAVTSVLEAAQPLSPEYVDGLKLLLWTADSRDRIREALLSSSRTLRRFALAACLRTQKDEALLRDASQSSDAEIAELAGELLEGKLGLGLSKKFDE